ncbi:hypothetical protein JCM8202_002739 [Rhodotorula sphaerocarpa]
MLWRSRLRVQAHDAASWLLRRPVTTRTSAASSPAQPPPRPRYDVLSKLQPAAHRLAFRSIPFSAPPTALFPPSSVPQFTTQNKFFSLRCFPSQPRSPAESTRSTSAPPKPPPAASPKKSLPTPPPSLDPSTLFLDAPPPARQALLARLARARKPYTLDLTILAGKKKVHKSAVVRERCRRRVRECVRAVVVRNADREEGGEGLRVGEGEVREVGPRKWLLPGYHYIMVISLEVYRCPLPDLVASVRTALTTLKTKAEAAALEAQLAEIEIAPRTRRPEEFSSSPPTAPS